MCGCLALQGVQIPHRIDRHLGGQIGGIGVPASRRHDRVHLDQLTTPIQFHRVRIDAGIQPPADQLAGDAVERLGDLHVPIRGDLGMGPGRDVEHLIGHRLELGLLVGGEHFGRAQPGGAVHPHPRHLPTPPLVAYRQSPISRNCSPAKKFALTYDTQRSTRGLSLVVNCARSGR